MEQVRLLLAIGLSFVVLFIWSVFFIDKQPEQIDNKEIVEKSQIKNNEEKNIDVENKIENNKQKNIVSSHHSRQNNIVDNPQDVRQVSIETPFYIVKISSKGATFKSYVLKKYKENAKPGSPDKQLIPINIKNGVLNSTLVNSSIKGFGDANYSISEKLEKISLLKNKKEIHFRWISDNGYIIDKKFTFDPKSYLVSLDVTIINNTDNAIIDSLSIGMNNNVEEEKGYGFSGPNALIDNSLKQIKIKNIDEENEFKGIIKWVGIEDQYFTYTIVPEKPIEGIMRLSIEDNIVSNRLITDNFRIESQQQKSFKYLVFMGPKSMELLNSLGHDLGKVLNFGFFDIIAKPCLWFLIKIHSIIPNYGFAIIILTIITKLILWPLGSKSYKSMNDMKKLQPLMAEIREKNKNDKQKMNQELMSLYKTYKINPMGGCLPMVLQIPVFFALYRMLYQAIELRHAPFIFWINDLSAPDRLFNFSFSIPFMQPPYGIPVLTIIMGATMLLQQKMSPPPGDPAQAKMMMLMPIVFTFIFINFSSGLVLYWLVNNILSISQQYYIQKKAK